MAVKMSFGEKIIEEKRIYNLTQLQRNNRKCVNKKAGTKTAKTTRQRYNSHCGSRFLYEKETSDAELMNPQGEKWVENGKHIRTIKHHNAF